MAFNSAWGLSPTGFYVPTYDEILDQIQDEFISRIDSNIVLTSNSNAGIIAALMARREKAQWEEMQLTYYSTFISTATDSALDMIGGNLGLTRKVDEPSFAKLKITTDGEYLIQAGEEFETDDGYLFELLTDLVTTEQDDGSWSGTAWVQSEDTGEDMNVAANTITVEADPDENIISVTNPEPAGGGQDREDDETYRERLRMENAASPGSTAAGIRSALMNLSGVREVRIVQNSTDKTDEFGNPPYSVHIYVLGGNEDDIASCLADYVAAGITMVGQKEKLIKDATGNMVDIKFDFATPKDIYASIKINTNESWNVDDGADQVKQAVADYINSLEMGDPLYITRLYPAVYGIEGVTDATIEIGTSKDNLAPKDILQKDFEAPDCDTTNVEVTVNGI